MKTMARFEFAREISARRRQTSDARLESAPSLRVRASHPLATVIEILRREGYYVGLNLTPETVADLHEATCQSPCFADRDPAKPFMIANREAAEQKVGRPMKVATYLDQQEHWPVFQQLRADPVLNAIANAYIGGPAVYIRSELFWSFAGVSTREEQRAAAQVFHCDINDFRTLKFFFHLSDVGPMSGPHVYIKKGPRRRTLFHQLLGQRVTSLAETSLVNAYRSNDVVPILGATGLGFAGDPYYFHKGDTPKHGSRLLMQLEFGCRRYRMWYLY